MLMLFLSTLLLLLSYYLPHTLKLSYDEDYYDFWEGDGDYFYYFITSISNERY